MTQAMTTGGARRVPARAVSSLPLWCKGGKRSHGVPRHQAKVAISVQRDQDQEDYETEVTMELNTASSPAQSSGGDTVLCSTMTSVLQSSWSWSSCTEKSTFA